MGSLTQPVKAVLICLLSFYNGQHHSAIFCQILFLTSWVRAKQEFIWNEVEHRGTVRAWTSLLPDCSHETGMSRRVRGLVRVKPDRVGACFSPFWEHSAAHYFPHGLQGDRRPTFPSVPNHKHRAVTNSELRMLRTRVVSLILNDQHRWESVGKQHGVSDDWVGKKGEAMNEILLRITWILIGIWWTCATTWRASVMS